MNVLYIEPGKEPREVEIDGSLQSMQELVKGLIQPFSPYEEEVVFVCNEEGKINGMEPNRALFNDHQQVMDILAGLFFICGRGEDEFIDLPAEKMGKYKLLFENPERISGYGSYIKVRPYKPDKNPEKDRDDGER